MIKCCAVTTIIDGEMLCSSNNYYFSLKMIPYAVNFCFGCSFTIRWLKIFIYDSCTNYLELSVSSA